MAGEEIGRQSNPVGRIAFQKFGWSLPRVMWRIESHIHEERLRAFGLFPQVADGGVRDLFAAVYRTVPCFEPVSLPSGIVGRPGIARGWTRIGCTRFRCGWKKSTGKRSKGLEATFQGIVGQMPFADHVGGIAGLAKRFPPKSGTFRQGTAIGSPALPQGPTGIEHGPTGNADCTAPSSLVESVSEQSSPARQPVEIGRMDVEFAEGTQSPKGLVVGKQQEKIGAIMPGRGKRSGTVGRNKDANKHQIPDDEPCHASKMKPCRHGED